MGIENPTPASHAIHDATDQERNFDYFSYHIDDTSRVTFLANAAVPTPSYAVASSFGVAARLPTDCRVNSMTTHHDHRHHPPP